MDIMSDEISAMVFKRTIRKDLGEFSLNNQMLMILMEFNGKERVGTIAKKTGLDLTTMRKVIAKLLNLRIIELAEEATPPLEKDFFDYLGGQLSRAVGPIAQILIEDAVTDLGHETNKFPRHRAAELVEFLAREIQREEKKNTFKQQMVQKIKELGEWR
jgi:hypothetical protein